MRSPVIASARRTSPLSGPERNRLRPEDRAVHDWHRFALSFPSHLVRDCLRGSGVDSQQRVLDPFCGTGTTLVECKRLGIPSVGIERNRMAAFASRTKLDWSVDPAPLVSHAKETAGLALDRLQRDGVDDFGPARLFRAEARPIADLRTLPPEHLSLLLKNSISPLPLHKTLVLLDALQQRGDDTLYAHQQLALASAFVSDIGNLHFGPEVGVGRIRVDAVVVGPWLERVKAMAHDLSPCGNGPGPKPPSTLRMRADLKTSWSPRPSVPSSRRRGTPTLPRRCARRPRRWRRCRFPVTRRGW